VEVQTGQIRELMGTPKLRNWHGRWSPNGQMITFLSQHSGWNEVWLVRPDGESAGQLTRLGADVNDLAWSPDGTRLAAAFTCAALSPRHFAVKLIRHSKKSAKGTR